MTRLDEPVGQRLVPLEAIALEHDVFVPVEAQPSEPVQNDQGVFVGGTLSIRVLDSDQERTTVFPGVKPVEECGPHSTHV
jgi:hypothetical protein